MIPRARDLAAAASLLWRCPSADLISVGLDTPVMIMPGSTVPLIVVRAHAHGWEEAERLAQVLGLPEIDGDRTPDTNIDGQAGWWVYRRWTGWAADASQDVPVSVHVFGGEFVEAAELDQRDQPKNACPVGEAGQLVAVPRAV